MTTCCPRITPPLKKAPLRIFHAQVVEWMRSGELNIKDFISDYFTFDQAVEAYQKLLDRKILKKGIITF